MQQSHDAEQIDTALSPATPAIVRQLRGANLWRIRDQRPLESLRRGGRVPSAFSPRPGP